MPIKKRPIPYSQEELNALFTYDAKTGIATNKVKRSKNTLAGTAAGCITSDGYLEVGLGYDKWLLHRIIWKMVYGEEPEEIDHINHVGTDNRLKNLRAVTKQENSKNTSMHKNNTSGITGVILYKRTSKYAAQIRVDGKKIHLGYFDTIEEAAAARQAAETLFGFHENHGK